MSMGEVEEVQKVKKQQKTDPLLLYIIGVTILSAVLLKLLCGSEYHAFLKTYGLTVILLFISFTGISLSKWNALLAAPGNRFIGIGYTIGLLFIICSVKYPVYNLWFLGSAVIGILVNEYLGISIQFILSYLYCGLNGHNLERMLFYFILGGIICFLGKYLYKASMAVYVAMIVLSCNIIFLFAMNSFLFEEALNEHMGFSVASTFLVLLLMYGMLTVKHIQPAGLEETASEVLEEKRALQEKNGSEKKLSSELKPLSEAETASEALEEKKTEEKPLSALELRQLEIDLVEPKEAIYDRILQEDYELLQQLKAKSPSLFAHCKKVAELSANGAVILGCSEKIAKAGGLYHEIGRLVSKDYITEGVALLEKQRFPKEVIAILKQQNAKLEKPKSKEAAIVMLSESVVSTITYLAREKKKALEEGREYKEQPLDKIIENIFDIRFGKGSLDESGVTILEYKKLKNYYIGIYK